MEFCEIETPCHRSTSLQGDDKTDQVSPSELRKLAEMAKQERREREAVAAKKAAAEKQRQSEANLRTMFADAELLWASVDTKAQQTMRPLCLRLPQPSWSLVRYPTRGAHLLSNDSTRCRKACIFTTQKNAS
jgi:hypothetical protein